MHGAVASWFLLTGVLIALHTASCDRLFEPGSMKYIATLPLPHALGSDAGDAAAEPGAAGGACAGAAYPAVSAVRIGPAGDRVVCQYADRSLYVWDVTQARAARVVRRARFHGDAVCAVEACPMTSDTAAAFATCGADDTVRVWGLGGSAEVDSAIRLVKVLSGPEAGKRRDSIVSAAGS
ncbi:Mitogen-activated protein kinase-binding protein 1, partial [Cladochytrium tenue]